MEEPARENIEEKMWIEIIQSMEKMYAELASLHGEIEKKNKKIESAYEEMRRMQMQIIQSEKMRSLGQMAAGIAHELNNPLGGIIVYAHLLLEDTPDTDPRKANIKKIIAESEKCRDIVKDLLRFTRSDTPNGKLINLKTVLQNTLSLLTSQAMFHNIEVETEFDDTLPPVKGNAGELQQVFTNVILNAVQAMNGKGKLTIKSYRRSSNSVCVLIADTGCGIPPENLRKIFEPFFTTKQAGQGIGLGLFITYSIVEKHGGRIEVDSEVGKGTSFRIILPIG